MTPDDHQRAHRNRDQRDPSARDQRDPNARDPTNREGRSLLRSLRPGTRQAIDWEIVHHIEERTDRLIAQGWDPAEARCEAERLFGDADEVRRELGGIARTDDGRKMMRTWIDTLRQDLRLTLRNIRYRPGFTIALVLTLGLGIGANAAIFSIVDALLLRPLPYRDADRIVKVELQLAPTLSVPWVGADQTSPLREAADYLEASTTYGHVQTVRSDGAEPEQVEVLAVSHELDDFLGAPLLMGRAFTADDAVPGAPGVAVLSQAYWQEHGADRSVLGRDIRIAGEPYTVVGVLARGFRFPVPGSSDLWVPLATDGTVLGRSLPQLSMVGRLAEGVSVEAAQERANVVSAGLNESTPHRFGWNVKLTAMDNWRANPDVRRAARMMMGAVTLILGIALLNGINLMLVRGGARVHEMGVRAAIGASGQRLTRQILTESLVMASLAGLVAVALALVGNAAARSIMPFALRWSSFHDFTVERRTLVFTFAVTWTIGLLLGVLPAIQAARHGRRLAGAANPQAARARATRVEHLLVAAEVALSVALLAGAGLFVNSFARLVSTDPGFDPEHLLAVDLHLSSARYATPPERAVFFDRFATRLSGLPGVTAVARAVGVPPSTSTAYGVTLRAEGAAPPQGQPSYLPMTSGGPTYLDALGTRLLAGRRLTSADAGEGNVVVDEPLARFLWPGGDALGKAFRTSDEGTLYTVVGITEDVKLMGVDDHTAPFDMFLAVSDSSAGAFSSVVLRAAGDPAALIPDVRRVLHEMDPEQAITNIQTGSEAMAGSLEEPRFLVSVMGLVAALAALLSVVGIFSVTAHTVGQRSKEFGIRVALGAPVGRVRGEVRRRALLWAGAGTIVGLAVALLLDGAASNLLYEVKPGDPLTYAVVALLMMLAALVGCDGPARRATRVDPVEVLKAE